MDELIQEFLVESNEGLDRLDNELVKLEATPGSPELLASIFRTIHSIKGACGFLGFQKLETLAHAAESLLSKLRDGKLRFTPGIGTAMLGAIDAIRQTLSFIGSTGQDGNESYEELVQQLKHLQENADSTFNPRQSTPEQMTVPASPELSDTGNIPRNSQDRSR